MRKRQQHILLHRTTLLLLLSLSQSKHRDRRLQYNIIIASLKACAGSTLDAYSNHRVSAPHDNHRYSSSHGINLGKFLSVTEHHVVSPRQLICFNSPSSVLWDPNVYCISMENCHIIHMIFCLAQTAYVKNGNPNYYYYYYYKRKI